MKFANMFKIFSVFKSPGFIIFKLNDLYSLKKYRESPVYCVYLIVMIPYLSRVKNTGSHTLTIFNTGAPWSLNITFMHFNECLQMIFYSETKTFLSFSQSLSINIFISITVYLFLLPYVQLNIYAF